MSVPQTGERAWAAGRGERSVGVFLGHANVPASTVSVPETGERAWAAGPGCPAAAPATPGTAAAALPVSSGQVAAGVAMPLADLMALVAAVAAAGLLGGLSSGLILGYAAAVFLVLSAIGLQRLRISLRVTDQLGRIMVAAAVPALAVAPWIAAAHAVALAAGTAGLLFTTRVAASAILRSAHRHGRLTERAVLVGAGPNGRQLATLLDEHPELGLRPVGFLDDAPTDVIGSAPVPLLPTVGGVGDLGAVVSMAGISRVIVCDPSVPDAELARALRAGPAAGRRRVRAATAVRTGCGCAHGLPRRGVGDPADPAAPVLMDQPGAARPCGEAHLSTCWSRRSCWCWPRR